MFVGQVILGISPHFLNKQKSKSYCLDYWLWWYYIDLCRYELAEAEEVAKKLSPLEDKKDSVEAVVKKAEEEEKPKEEGKTTEKAGAHWLIIFQCWSIIQLFSNFRIGKFFRKFWENFEEIQF